jgi:hypothetical protein
VVAGDAVYVGTDNARHMNPAYPGTAGVLMAFERRMAISSGRMCPASRARSAGVSVAVDDQRPYVEGNRLYYVTAECQLRALDTQGFRDGENNGPYREEVFQDNAAADIVWELDICGRLGVFPHEATNSEVLPVGDLLMVSTSNGQNEGHMSVPSPRAPSLIAVDKRSGDVVWRAIGAGKQVLHGQWSSPVAAQCQWPHPGALRWRRWLAALLRCGRRVTKCGDLTAIRKTPAGCRALESFRAARFIASPVFDDGRVFVAMGQSPGHGNGPLIDSCDQVPTARETSPRAGCSGRLARSVAWWERPLRKTVSYTLGTWAERFIVSDAATGAHVWKHETNEAIWGSLLLAGDRLYVGNVEGTMTVLRAGTA